MARGNSSVRTLLTTSTCASPDRSLLTLRVGCYGRSRWLKRKSYGRTKSGVELTEEVVAELAAEAERGYEVDKLVIRRRGRPSMGSAPAEALPVRLDPELRKAVDERAAADKTSASEVVREALRRYLKIGRRPA
jgi:predicted HicB family RNase H-like nuclease